MLFCQVPACEISSQITLVVDDAGAVQEVPRNVCDSTPRGHVVTT